jgi:hypothetical protein
MVMRSFQGLLFLGIAIFSLKWEFVQPVTHHGVPAIETIPPMRPWILFSEASVRAVVGIYLLATGDWTYWRGQKDRFSGDTFLAATSGFLAVFLRKFAYTMRQDDPVGFYPPYNGYFPPFDKVSLGLAFFALILLGIYYWVRGEVAFWKWRRVTAEPAGNPRP